MSRCSFFLAFSFHFLFSVVAAQNRSTTTSISTEALEYRYACLDQSGSSPSSNYNSNLNSLISLLSSDASTSNGFGNRTLGGGGGDDDESSLVYGLYLCRGDVNRSLCHSCVRDSGNLVQQHCPNNASAILWYPFCLIRYQCDFAFVFIIL